MKTIKKIIILILLTSIFASSTGCALFRNPFKSWTKAETKVETTQKQIETNQDSLTQEARNYIYGEHIALLMDPSTSRYHEVETTLNDKALITLGNPTMEDVDKLQKMVSNLLSTNTQIVIKGEKQLADMDNEVKSLQEENNNLQSKLSSAEEKLIKVGTENSGLAQKWSNLVKIFWWVLYGIIAMVVIRVVTAILPPPYNSLGAIVSVPLGLISKFIHASVPQAQAVAGVVSKDYQAATEQLINVLQELKSQNPALHPAISASVANNIDSNLIPVINQSKSSIGLVS
jgi:cell division septum initiation protein DivIVA